MEGRSWGSALVHLGELHQDAWGARSSPQLPAHLSCLAGSGGALWGPLSKPKADSTNELQHKLGIFQQLLAPQQGRAAPCPQQVMGGRGQGRAGRGSQPPACPRLCPAGHTQHFLMAGEWRSRRLGLGFGSAETLLGSWGAPGGTPGAQGITPGNFGHALPTTSSSSSEPPVLRSPQMGNGQAKEVISPKRHLKGRVITTVSANWEQFGALKCWGGEFASWKNRCWTPRRATAPYNLLQRDGRDFIPCGGCLVLGCSCGVGGTREGLAVFW